MMRLDVLRRKTPSRVRQELWTGLLAYNLIRQSMLHSAIAKRRRPPPLHYMTYRQALVDEMFVLGTEK